MKKINIMKASKDTLQLLSLAAVLILSTSACNKTPIEEVKFPKKIELLVGQSCLPWVAIDEYEPNSTSGSHSSSSSEAGIIINGDTIDWNSNTTTNNTNSSYRKYIFKNS